MKYIPPKKKKKYIDKVLTAIQISRFLVFFLLSKKNPPFQRIRYETEIESTYLTVEEKKKKEKKNCPKTFVRHTHHHDRARNCFHAHTGVRVTIVKLRACVCGERPGCCKGCLSVAADRSAKLARRFNHYRQSSRAGKKKNLGQTSERASTGHPGNSLSIFACRNVEGSHRRALERKMSSTTKKSTFSFRYFFF